MHVAIRRVLPTARQRLARPARLGLPRLRAPPSHARALSCAPRCLDSPAGPPKPHEKHPDAPDDRPAAPATRDDDDTVPAPPESAFPPDDMADDVANAYGGSGSGGSGDRPTRTRGRPTGSKTRRIARPLPKPTMPQWFVEQGVILRENIPARMEPAKLKIVEYEQPEEEQADPGQMETKTSPPPAVEMQAEPAEMKDKEKQEKEEEPTLDLKEPDTAAEDAKEVAPTPGAPPPDSAGDKSAAETAQEASLASEAASLVRGRYELHEPVWREIKAHVHAGLSLPKVPYADSMASIKSHCLLHFPKEGGVYFLDSITERLAMEEEADLIRIDAQDLAEIAGDYLGDSQSSSGSPQSYISPLNIRALGYDTQVPPSQSRARVVDEEQEYYDEEEAYEDEEVEPADSPAPPNNFSPMFNLSRSLMKMFQSGQIQGAVIPLGGSSAAAPMLDTSGARGRNPHEAVDRMNERKIASLLDTMVSAAHSKRQRMKAPPPPPTNPDSTDTGFSKQTNADTTEPLPTPKPEPVPFPKTIVHIRDYRELERTTSGTTLLKMLHEIVQARRREGERILILGTTSNEEAYTSLSKIGLRALQARPEESLERTIVVPPGMRDIENAIFKLDRDSRVREINIRHLRDMIWRRSGEAGEAAILDIPDGWHFNPSFSLTPADNAAALVTTIEGISENVWTFDRVHRVATVALGERQSGKLTINNIASAIDTLERSDASKFAWAARERTLQQEKEEADAAAASTGKLKLPKDCNKHEKKLLPGVINPANLHTTFDSVRAPASTIESMKTLTMLSLIRPDAFKYGVLATDRIPGVLLYGPPGTGKTLLAKAVAKESGANVLEVAGSEIFDMYVGEGEKNVKAIFTLARKLSPCVIFIDEADAIFGSRSSHAGRTTHREIINQFLKEWADLQATAFVMVATNRPFDLDDAVLRRLPRRILIDLPTRDDRRAILHIHLQTETLAPDVNLDRLADRTPLYSGSDLKNLCVSAALAAVKQEADAFKSTGAYPDKRVLTQAHFEKALMEISASISDDMGSLAAIRKFDEKYGERRGGRKRKSTLGFAMGAEDTPVLNEGRVRQD